MNAVRAFFMHHRAVAMLLVGLALCIKALVPAGYMVDPHAQVLRIQICDGSMDHATTRNIVIPMKGSADGAGGSQGDDCSFSSLTLGGVARAAPALLALMLAFILLAGFLPVAAQPAGRVLSLWPPLRGPPMRFLTA